MVPETEERPKKVAAPVPRVGAGGLRAGEYLPKKYRKCNGCQDGAALGEMKRGAGDISPAPRSPLSDDRYCTVIVRSACPRNTMGYNNLATAPSAATWK